MSAEIWKDIKGYNGKYQVSNFGNFRRIYKTKHPKTLKPYIKKSSNNGRYVIHLTGLEGKVKEEVVSGIVAKHFLGDCPDGYVAIHINGVQSDNYSNNLKYVSKHELGLLTGRHSRRQPVVKIDNFGELIEFYSSARECARKNYMSYQTIIDRCNGKVKSIYAPDGYAYAWDDDKYISKVIRKIEIDNGFMVKANVKEEDMMW